MQKLSRLIAIFMLAFFSVGVLASPAQADDDHPSWRIPKYDVVADVDTTGTVNVKLQLDFDFAHDSGHGPYIFLPLRQRIADDPDHWRMLDVSDVTVSSSSGANAETQIREEDGSLLIRIGSERKTYQGVQSYEINYSIRGLISANNANSGLDEVNWNAVGTGWEVRIAAASVTLTGPAEINKTACFTGENYTDTCTSSQSGAKATFSASSIGNGDPMQIVAGFPAGTFPNAQPRLEKRYHFGNMFPANPATISATAILTLLGLLQLFRVVRRRGRDEVFLGMAPGSIPSADQNASVGKSGVKASVAVAFAPPQGARPGEIGTIMDKSADDVDVTATIIDLAVRGFMRIEQQDKKKWTFTALPPPAQLTAYENHVLETLFQKGNSVTTKQLKQEKYSSLITGTQSLLYERVTKDLHWFKRNPQHSMTMAVFIAVLVIIGTIALGVGLGIIAGFGLVGLAGVIVGLAVLCCAGKFGSRTALGSAMLAQAKGFELYLTTAEADQIKWEEGEDIFSRYLPYAIIFGVTDRWVKIFDRLIAQGLYTPTAAWYYSPYGYGFGYGFSGFTSSMDSLTASIGQAMTASQSATVGSSGGSGFSGGGGFGGGGGGGW